MPTPLPPRASLEFLRKLAKDRLATLREADPAATLSQAQLAVAREYGFPSWRRLKARVDALRHEEAAPAPAVAPDDPDLARLIRAVDVGDNPAIVELLTKRPALASASGPGGRTPLHVAAERNDPRVAAALVSLGADLNARYGESGHTPLSWAVTCNAPDAARVLIHLGSKPDLFTAAGLGAVEVVAAFFDETGTLRPGASQTGSSRFDADGRRLPCPPTSPVDQVSDALVFACRNGQPAVVRLLLEKQPRPDLSFRAYLGATALHWAHFGGAAEVVRRLEQAGADGSARDATYRCTPRAFGLVVAASWGFPWMVRARLDADPSLLNFPGEPTTPLHEAAKSGHLEVVRLLLERGADPAARDADGRTAAEVAAAGGQAAVADWLNSGGMES